MTVYPPEEDPSLDDQPCQTCGDYDLSCWVDCDECESGTVYEDGDPFMDDDCDEWGGVYRRCRKCDGEGGWCGQPPTERQAVDEEGRQVPQRLRNGRCVGSHQADQCPECRQPEAEE